MTITDAERLLMKYYKQAQKSKYVKNPLAWALYHVWKIADNEGNETNMKRGADNA